MIIPPSITTFDVHNHHIHVEFFVTDVKGVKWAVAGVLDTGAPRTEFSDRFLDYAGFIELKNEGHKIRSTLQTQKYAKIILPSVEICGYILNKFEAYISRFDTSWGVDALIGLDFFRRFKVTVDYRAGHLITEPYAML